VADFLPVRREALMLFGEPGAAASSRLPIQALLFDRFPVEPRGFDGRRRLAREEHQEPRVGRQEIRHGAVPVSLSATARTPSAGPRAESARRAFLAVGQEDAGGWNRRARRC